MLTEGSASSSKHLPPFVALQHRDFRLLWMGQLISQAGSQMQVVAINWHIYVLTGSPVALGLVSLSRFVPIVIFSLIGGVFADTYDRKRITLYPKWNDDIRSHPGSPDLLRRDLRRPHLCAFRPQCSGNGF